MCCARTADCAGVSLVASPRPRACIPTAVRVCHTHYTRFNRLATTPVSAPASAPRRRARALSLYSPRPPRPRGRGARRGVGVWGGGQRRAETGLRARARSASRSGCRGGGTVQAAECVRTHGPDGRCDCSVRLPSTGVKRGGARRPRLDLWINYCCELSPCRAAWHAHG